MKKFILNIFKFTGLCCVLLLGFHLLLVKIREPFIHLPQNINKVFLGNSTVEFGVDDSKIQNSVNFAQNAEPIDITYAKFKLISRYNPSIDTIFVELDDIVLFNDRLAPVVSNYIYFDSFSLKDWHNNIHFYNFERFTKYFSHSYDIIKLLPVLKGTIKGDINLQNIGVGGYAKLYRDKLHEDITRCKPAKRSLENIPESTRYYYQRICEYAKTKNKTIIFYNTPKHKLAWNDTLYLDFYRDNLSDYKLIDCTRFHLPDSCFSDISHLNYTGSSIFSDTLNNMLYK